MTLIRKIARHIVQMNLSQIPVGVAEKAKSHILDAIGCGLYGWEFEAPRILLQLANDWSGRSESSIIGTGMKTPSAMAAKINGVAVHVADFDDSSTDFRGHPTCVVLPAVLALCESSRKSGRDLLLSYISGVEIGGKLGRVMGWSHYEAGWHGTSTIGTIASAVASSMALDLNEEKTGHALAIAASGACGIRENFGTMVKSLHAGQASAAGVTAALLAERGYEGSLTAFEGQSGFGRVYSGEGAIGRWADELNELNTVMGVMFKRYPSCAGTHPALDILEELMEEQPFSWEEVEEIKCLVAPVLPSILIHPRPTSGLEAKFSMPYCISAFLVHGKLDLTHFEKEAVEDSRVRRLMEKVQMIPDERRGNLMRATGALAPTEVHVKLKNRTMSKEMLEAKGSASFPLEREEIEGKFRACAGRILPAEKVDKAIDLIFSLENLENIGTLTETINP